jgi:uncharacterized repeat protein (TIGR03837 family)
VAGGTRRLTTDIFCAVVDNYGDIGVCWRLARQLATEHNIRVRLWLDDLQSLKSIAPAMVAPGVEVCLWGKDFPVVEPADVVVEAFACDLPPSYIAAMVARAAKPVWINLEYLSAESWVAGCHLGQSRHPSLPLTKYFFFPGFTPDTGGLIRETGLGQDFDPSSFWQRFGLPQPQADELRISLFGYDNPALDSLLQSWAEGTQPVTCLVPQGALAERARRLFGTGRGNLRLHQFQFLPQDDYDRLLWACDCNFVRGEDSFVRAQWAARPLVWHIYPQQQDAHWPKLEAFLDCYCSDLPSVVASDLRNFWQAWNRGIAVDWAGFWRNRTALQLHAGAWKAALTGQTDLASNLVNFCTNKV